MLMLYRRWLGTALSSGSSAVTLATMVPMLSSSGILYTGVGLGQKCSRHSSFSGARESGVWAVGILVSAKYSAELFKLHQHAPRENRAAERKGNWLLYSPRSHPWGRRESTTRLLRQWTEARSWALCAPADAISHRPVH